MNRIILAIDDEPRRYYDFQCDALVVTFCRVEDYYYWLHQHRQKRVQVVGILLDHDMPFQDGQWFAARIREDYHVPVALTSNNATGRDAMHAILSEYEVPVIHCDCTWPEWQQRAQNHIFNR